MKLDSHRHGVDDSEIITTQQVQYQAIAGSTTGHQAGDQELTSRLQFYQWLETLICCSRAEDKILVVR